MSCLSCRISEPAVHVGFLNSVSDLWDAILPVYYTWRNTAWVSEFNDSKHLIADKPPCSFAIQTGKGEKTRLGKLAKNKERKNANPCLIPCSPTVPWPLSASSTVVAQLACPSEDLHDKKGNTACVVKFTNPKLVLRLPNRSVTDKGVCV